VRFVALFLVLAKILRIVEVLDLLNPMLRKMMRRS